MNNDETNGFVAQEREIVAPQVLRRNVAAVQYFVMAYIIECALLSVLEKEIAQNSEFPEYIGDIRTCDFVRELHEQKKELKKRLMEYRKPPWSKIELIQSIIPEDIFLNIQSKEKLPRRGSH